MTFEKKKRRNFLPGPQLDGADSTPQTVARTMVAIAIAFIFKLFVIDEIVKREWICSCAMSERTNNQRLILIGWIRVPFIQIFQLNNSLKKEESIAMCYQFHLCLPTEFVTFTNFHKRNDPIENSQYAKCKKIVNNPNRCKTHHEHNFNECHAFRKCVFFSFFISV